MAQRIRFRSSSLPILLEIDEHIRFCDIRGPVSRFRDCASDRLDGAYFRRELRDLIRHGLLKIVEHGFDDSMGRDVNRDRDPQLCGTSWSVDPTERLIRACWPDRIHGEKLGSAEGGDAERS